MADEFIQVMEKEDGELVEFPTEEDGTLLLRTIQTQYATAIGLRYKGPSGAWRAVKEGDNAELLAPKDGWGDSVYYLRFSDSDEEDRTRKRKNDETNDLSSDAKQTKPSLLRDMVVLNIPFDTQYKGLKNYLDEKYGGNARLLIKTDSMTGQCMGYGFVKFDNEESARKALESEDDEFMGRKISIKAKTQKPLRMYVNGLAEGTTKEDLVKYFSKFGEVTDSYIPTPFRHFGFFTFADGDIGRACMREEHTFKGRKIHVKIRNEGGGGLPDGPAQFGFGGGRGGYRGGRGGGRGSFGGGRGGRGDARGGRGGRGDARGGRGGVGGGRGGGLGGRGSFGRGRGGFQNPQMAAQFKDMLFQFMSETGYVY